MTEFIAIFTDTGNWLVGQDYSVNIGGVKSVKSGQPLLGVKWQYWNDGWKDDDNTLTLTGSHRCNIIAV